MKIKIHHIEKIEGHAGFFADIWRGKIKSAKVKVLEGARLIEGIIIGRHYQEVPLIVSRICGICSAVHNITSLKALERIFRVTITPATEQLRRLLLAAEIIQSHAAHIFFLSLADFFNLASDANLIKKEPRLSRQVILIRNFANYIKEVIGGRDIHLLTTTIGGFTKPPARKEIDELQRMAEPALKAAIALAKFLQKLSWPKYKKETEFICLHQPKGYPLDGNEAVSNFGLRLPAGTFVSQLEELQASYDAVERVKYQGKPFMVGAIARINNNSQALNPEAKKLLSFLQPLPDYNIFHNVYYQAVEIAHFIEEADKLLKQYARGNQQVLPKKYQVRSGVGVGVAEAPRGTLYHIYSIDRYGIIKKANIITPTAQFLLNLEDDLAKFLGQQKKLNKEQQKKYIQMLVRAYDPCMTCATH